MMKIGNKNLTKGDIVRWSAYIALQIFNIFSAVYFFAIGKNAAAGMCFASMAYTTVPFMFEWIFRFRIQPTLFIVIGLYTVCPMIGYSYGWYHRFVWWDDVMHGFSGVIFAMFGAYLGVILNKGEVRVALCAVLAIAFSMGISMLWEFTEFTCDTLFGTDMQKDTLLTTMRPSYVLGELLGLGEGVTSPDGAQVSLVVGGQTFGYIDMGLLDTMLDMFVETTGAVVYTLVYIIGKGKHFVFVPLPKKQTQPQLEVEESPLAEAAVSEVNNE